MMLKIMLVFSPHSPLETIKMTVIGHIYEMFALL